MSWILLTIDILLSIAARCEQIESLDFNPYCRDCDVPEGMDW